MKSYVLGTIAQEERNFSDTINTLNYISDIKYFKKIERSKLPELKPIVQEETNISDIKQNITKVPQSKLPKISSNYKYLNENKKYNKEEFKTFFRRF